MRLCRAGAFAFSKRLLFGEDCLRVISETAQEVGRVAGVTLGPRGRNVVIEDHKQLPRITRDGVTVVKHLEYVPAAPFSKIVSKTQSARSSSDQWEPPTASPATAPPPPPSSSQNCSVKGARCCRQEPIRER